MKKVVSVLAAVMFAVLTVVPMTGALAARGDQLYVASADGKGAVVMSKDNGEGNVLVNLGEGMPVRMEAAAGAEWTKVTAHANGKYVTGYAKNDTLGTVDPAGCEQHFTEVEAMKAQASPRFGRNGYVNMRSEANLQSRNVTRLHKGDVVTVLAESEAWYKVKDAKGNTGYVVKAYVQAV